MMMDGRISREELVKIYQIEISFFDELEESGLLKTEVADNIRYLTYDDLPVFERLANWHYDLGVNTPGLEVISHLMQKIEKLQHENRSMIRRMRLLSDSWDEAELL
ncbi:chaperone modulator CbpM [Daejeonia sp. YH14]|uniref:chaperone modulator CbpM n=1 Tax=Daejeonia sp. YH14 TaxID=3439042 RepID=UPI003F490F5E